MVWLYVDYEPISPFTLRPSNTTSTGGKSLLAPTPYAIKMGLLDRLIRHIGIEDAGDLFPAIRDLTLYMRVPLATAVNRTFQKVLRNYDSKELRWTPTIAQIEFCVASGLMQLAIPMSDDSNINDMLVLGFSAINYFGKRGSFMQMVDINRIEDAPDNSFINLCEANTQVIPQGFLQRMDDMLPDASFEDVSIFNPKAKGGRRSYTVVFPYQLEHHGSNHTVYQRMQTP